MANIFYINNSEEFMKVFIVSFVLKLFGSAGIFDQFEIPLIRAIPLYLIKRFPALNSNIPRPAYPRKANTTFSENVLSRIVGGGPSGFNQLFIICMHKFTKINMLKSPLP